MNIEEIAKASPSYIYKDGIDITTGDEISFPSMQTKIIWKLYFYHVIGMTKEQAEAMAKKLGFSEECIDEVKSYK